MKLLIHLKGLYSIYECPKCKEGFKTRDLDVKHEKVKQCRPCSEKPKCTQEHFSMELIKVYPKRNDKNTRNDTFVDLRCPMCSNIHSYQAASANRSNYTECRDCRIAKLFTGKKTCTGCKEEKELNEFTSTRKSSTGKYSRCRLCRYNAAKERRKTFDKVEEYGKFAEKTYNITREEAIKLRQDSVICDICQKSIEWKDRHLDHCHSSGKIRGILCPQCNKGLGLFKDSILFLENAANYLKEHNDTF